MKNVEFYTGYYSKCHAIENNKIRSSMSQVTISLFENSKDETKMLLAHTSC